MDELLNFARDGLAFLQPYPALQALTTIGVFLGLALLADRVISGIVRRLAARTATTLDDRLIASLHRPVFATVALIGLVLASAQLDLGPQVEDTTVNIIETLLVIVWMVFALRASGLLFEAASQDPNRFRYIQPATRPLFSNAVAVFVVVAAAYAILVSWQIDVTGLVASAGIVGLALSFAAQDTLSNLFAGIAIMADRPYQIGDYIILDTGERGQVTHIGLRSTRLLTRDDVEVTIPNGVMGKAKIVNEAGGPRERYRIRVPVGVAYGSDIDQVMDTLLGVAQAHPKIVTAPEARVRFRAFGESSLDFELLCWIVQPADRGLVQHELNCSIYKAFGAAGIQIPFPQRDLHIRQVS
jgi:small-conductance mechanosensitive channel